MGRRNRQRIRAREGRRPDKVTAPVGEYRDDEGNVLVLRGSLPAGARREFSRIMAGGLNREDAWQRATEMLFERLAISWTIAGLEITSQKELLGRYRMAAQHERQFVRDALREHARERFPELEAP